MLLAEPRSRRFAPGALALAALCILLASRTAAASSPETPVVVPAVTGHTGDLSVLGAPVRIEGRLTGSLVAVQSTVFINGPVSGDVILFGGEIAFGREGVIEKDLLLIGAGSSHATGRVRGRTLGLAAMEAAFLSELETSPLAGAAVSPLLIAFRLGLLGVWLLLGLAVLFMKPRALGRAADSLRTRPTSSTLLGLLAIFSGILASTLIFLWIPAQVSLVLIGLLAGMFVLAKAFGLAAVALLVGRLCTRGAPRGGLLFGDPAALSAGLLVLGAVSLLPLAGPVIWGFISVVGIGVSVLVLIVPAEPLDAI
ncbi:MAG: hypothetical protein IT186_02435 [Acidobacteria bacterium]|nr:hypothetical protein [Acidobacteriota bacterium]MCK6682407.1 hypothetical protein [Thermoanaerobaculia bacterium]